MKLKRYKTYYFFIAALLATVLSYGQNVVITFNAAVYGQNLEGLSFVQLMSSYPQDLTGKVVIKVREIKTGNVASITIPGVYLRRGNNTIDRLAFSRSRLSFGNNYYGRTLSQSGKFPEGEYEYCFEVDLSESKIPVAAFFENCFTHELQPMTPLLLINPVDGDEDCNKRPHFTWQPPMPMPAGARFRLVLTEIKEKQDIIEAINYNPPIINQGNIPINQLSYPFNAPELMLGKRYAWQVIVYAGTTIIKRSEVWVYTVKCNEEKQQVSTDSYREMKETNDGNFYAADKAIRFSFHNPYSAGDLNYSIVSLANPEKVIKKLPELKMQAGLNKFDIDLSENKSFKSGEEYLLTVKLINGRELKLRFTFKKETGYDQ